MGGSLSRAQFEDLVVIPCGADVGVTESPEPLQQHSVKAGWNGGSIISGPPDARKLVTTLSADGTRWGPTFEGLTARTPLVLHSGRYEAARIPAGSVDVVLRFLPVPDPRKRWGFAVLAHRLDDGRRRLPLTVDGRRVILDEAQDIDVSVQYRPIRPVRVVSVMAGAADLVRGTQSWSVKVVDR